jgi:lysophospholipase L1-like esterase
MAIQLLRPLLLLANVRMALATLLLTGLVLGQTSFAQSQSDPRWVTTWAASPSTLVDPREDAPDINNQTLRLIVHTSAGGSALRLRLANYHGDMPMHLGAVTVALQSEGSGIQAGTSKAVTFGGESSITITRGGVVMSDPIAFAVPALTNLSISLYLPDDAGFITSHNLGMQTNYISTAGNHTTSASLAGATEVTVFNLLTAIDVIAAEGISTIATVGDSITDGYGSTVSANQRWPNHFARRLYSDSSIKNFAIASGAISGNRVTTEGSARFGENLQARFERDVLALSNVTHMVLLEGINDIGMSSRSGELISADAIISGYKQIIARAHARGIKVIGATLTPYEGAAYYSPEGEVVRQTVNNFIRTGGAFDGVIDFEKAVQDPANPTRLRADFTTDNLHPNDAGYKSMADMIDLNLFR